MQTEIVQILFISQTVTVKYTRVGAIRSSLWLILETLYTDISGVIQSLSHLVHVMDKLATIY